MRSWTRTLNLDDAHTLLALAVPGRAVEEWTTACHATLPRLSAARRRELIRMVRDAYLSWEDGRVEPGLFLSHYTTAAASAQVELVAAQWALTHPLPLLAVERLVHPALDSGSPEIALEAFTTLVGNALTTASDASLAKSRTVLLGALEGVGALSTSGTGRHRRLFARRGCPLPETRDYLVARGGPTLPTRLMACADSPGDARDAVPPPA